MDERKKFGAGNKAEQMPQEVATAEKALESFSRKAAEILVSHGVQGTVEEIKKYIEEDYDPSVFNYFEVITIMLLDQSAEIFGNEIYDNLERAYNNGLDDIEFLKEPPDDEDSATFKAYANISLRYTLAYLRSLALLHQQIDRENTREQIREFFRLNFAEMIAASGIKIEDSLKFELGLPASRRLNRLTPEESQELERANARETENIIESNIRAHEERMIEEGVDPAIARRNAEVRVREHLANHDRETEFTDRLLRKELTGFLKQIRHPDKLADMVLGPAENFKKE